MITNRAISEGLEKLIGKEFKVLDRGFIRVVDYMGNDASVTQAARISYGAGTKAVSEDKALIGYLLRNSHTSVFEMAEIKFHIKLPIFIMRQLVRHRTASLNEYSARYSEIKDEFYIPDPERVLKQSSSNKQCSSDDPLDEEIKRKFFIQTDDIVRSSVMAYEDMNKAGVARELNRIRIPLNNYTEIYWKMDLHNLLHFIRLRIHPHAQYEIRVYAEVLLDIVKEWCPFVYESFVKYSLNSVQLSSIELDSLAKCIDKEKLLADLELKQKEGLIKKREFNELKTKFSL